MKRQTDYPCNLRRCEDGLEITRLNLCDWDAVWSFEKVLLRRSSRLGFVLLGARRGFRAEEPSVSSRRYGELPFSRAALRTRMLQLAGIDEQEMARAARQALDVLKRNLSTTKIELVSFQGNYREVEVPDNTVNQRAAESLLDFTGISLSRQDSGDGPVDVIVNIQFPAACRPTNVIDHTPATALDVTVTEQGADQDDAR